MTITFLENAGLYLQSQGCGLLVDAPNREKTLFDGIPQPVVDAMAAGEPPYDALCGMVFTHKHSDHYDKKRVRQLTDSRPNLTVFATNGATPPTGELTIGCYTIRYFTVPHSGAEFAEEYHRTFLISDGIDTIYVAGDSVWDKQYHLAILDGVKLTAAVWNPNFVSMAEGRELLQLAQKNYVNHFPIQSEAMSGIGRKCKTSFTRYPDELQTTTLVDALPLTVEI